MDVVIDHRDGGEAAGAKTSSDLQREHPVRCRFSDIDLEIFLEGLEHFLASANVTSRAKANANNMLAARDGGKEGVKGHYPGHFAVRDLEPEADMFEDGLGEITKKILGGLKDRDERPIGLGEAIDHGIKTAEHFLFGGLTNTSRGRAFRILGFYRLSIQRVTFRDTIVKSGTIGRLS